MKTGGPAAVDWGSAVARAGDHRRKTNSNPHFDDCLIAPPYRSKITKVSVPLHHRIKFGARRPAALHSTTCVIPSANLSARARRTAGAGIGDAADEKLRLSDHALELPEGDFDDRSGGKELTR
jgi:hypothetical protein